MICTVRGGPGGPAQAAFAVRRWMWLLLVCAVAAGTSTRTVYGVQPKTHEGEAIVTAVFPIVQGPLRSAGLMAMTVDQRT